MFSPHRPRVRLRWSQEPPNARRFKGGAKGGGQADQAAEDAREQEAQRQEQIRQGTAAIDTIFDGGFGGTNPIAPDALHAGGHYFDAAGRPVPMNSISDRDTQMAEAGLLFSKTGQRSGGFTPDFYQDRRQSYLDYATPQLEDQHTEAVKKLTLALARNGTLESSIRGQRFGRLQQDYDLQKQGVADKAVGFANDARSQVEQSRADLIRTLGITGDATAASQGAINQSRVLSQPPSYDPLSQLFVDVTGGLATQAQLESRGTARVNTGLFPRAPGASQKIVYG